MPATLAGHIEDERLRTMLYALQIAISNLSSGPAATENVWRCI